MTSTAEGLSEVADEEVQGPCLRLVGGRLVVHRRGVPVAEHVAHGVAVELDPGATLQCRLYLLDPLWGDEGVEFAVLVHARAFQAPDMVEHVVDRGAVVADCPVETLAWCQATMGSNQFERVRTSGGALARAGGYRGHSRGAVLGGRARTPGLSPAVSLRLHLPLSTAGLVLPRRNDTVDVSGPW